MNNLSPENTIILACGNLRFHLDAAQEKMNTSFPIIELDTSYHSNPELMRSKIIETINMLPSSVNTILVCMGYCGGSWKDIKCDKTVIIPRLDDCVTLLLTTDNEWHPNLKKTGCLYLKDSNDNTLSISNIKKHLIETMGEKRGQKMFDLWFDSYHTVSIIDTGIYDCHSKEYVESANENAALIHSKVEYIKGSNLILEKLVSGNWDEQFMILQPGEIMTELDLLS